MSEAQGSVEDLRNHAIGPGGTMCRRQNEIHRHGLIELGPRSLGTLSFLMKPAGGVFGSEGCGENWIQITRALRGWVLDYLKVKTSVWSSLERKKLTEEGFIRLSHRLGRMRYVPVQPYKEERPARREGMWGWTKRLWVIYAFSVRSPKWVQLCNVNLFHGVHCTEPRGWKEP